MLLIAGDMSVPMEKDVEALRGPSRRNMHQVKPNAVSLEINFERPVRVIIAISVNDGHRWADALDFFQNAGRTNIPKMPDLIGVGSER